MREKHKKRKKDEEKRRKTKDKKNEEARDIKIRNTGQEEWKRKRDKED